MPIFVWNFGLVVSTSALAGLGGLAASAIVLDISEITQFIDHNKSSSILQLIKCKSRDLQKLLRYFDKTTTSVSNLSKIVDVFLVIFVLCSKD